MKTIEKLNQETDLRSANRSVATSLFTTFKALCTGALLTVCALPRAEANVYSLNVVGVVSDMTVQVLNPNLTTEQRQALHARNFNQLPPSARPLYLFAVAYDLGAMVETSGKSLSSAQLAQRLQSVSSIYEIPTVPPEDVQTLAAYTVVVDAALQELNVLITGQVENNTSLQEATDSGTVNGFVDYYPLDY